MIGPYGIGIYSTLFNIIGLFTAAFPIGSIGLNKYFSEFFESNKLKEINFLLKKFLILNFYLTLPIVAGLVFFSKEISNVLFSDTQYSLLIILLACSLPLSILTGFFDIYLRGIRKINNYVFFLSVNSILSIIVFIPLQIYLHLPGVFIALIISGVLSVTNGLLILKRIKLLPNLFSTIKVDSEITRNILKFGIASIIMLAAQQLSLLGIRLFIISKYSIVDSGIFQSVFSISNNYFGLFFTIIGAYAIPKLSSFGSDYDKIKAETNDLLKLFLLLYTPIIITVFLLKDWVLIILYSKEFISAENLFGFQLSGDFFKSISWSLGLWLIPCLRIKEWLIFDIMYSLNFILIFYLFQTFTTFGIVSISIAYMLTNLIHLLVIGMYIRRTLQFKFEKDVFRILLYSTLFIAFVFFSSMFIQKNYQYILLIAPVCFVILCFRKEEFKKFIGLFTEFKLRKSN